jgi:hypothetical protein
MRIFNTILAIGAVLCLTAVAATTALADGLTVGSNHVLQVETGGTASVGWQRGSDSRFDANGRRLHAVVPDDGASYFAVYTTRSLNVNRPLLNVQNLSFEFSENGHVGAGAPRISVILDDGTVLYLSATYCNHSVGQTNGTGPIWGRADFTRDLNDCSIWDSGGNEYSADGSRTALEVYVAANPNAIVDQTFLVGDEPGKYNLDRIALGTNRMYVRSFHSAVRCRSEGQC